VAASPPPSWRQLRCACSDRPHIVGVGLGLACGPPIALAVGLMLFAAAAALGLRLPTSPKEAMSATALRLEMTKMFLRSTSHDL